MTAKELHETQTKYDLLHHRKRIIDLESLPHLSFEGRRLLEQSYRIIARPCEGYHSVNLDDIEYVKELDEFATSESEE